MCVQKAFKEEREIHLSITIVVLHLQDYSLVPALEISPQTKMAYEYVYIGKGSHRLILWFSPSCFAIFNAMARLVNLIQEGSRASRGPMRRLLLTAFPR